MSSCSIVKCSIIQLFTCLLWSEFFVQLFCSIDVVQLHLFRPPGRVCVCIRGDRPRPRARLPLWLNMAAAAALNLWIWPIIAMHSSAPLRRSFDRSVAKAAAAWIVDEERGKKSQSVQ